MEEKKVGSVGWTIMFILGALFVVGWAAFSPLSFSSATKASPFGMGFMKFFILGTIGEIIKCGIARKRWAVDWPVGRAIVWGGFGIWITLAFPLFSAGVDFLIKQGLWWSWFPALSKSLWINLLGGYAWSMMMTHEYFNFLIKERLNAFGLCWFADQMDRRFAFRFVPKTMLFFWVPAHTATFSLPPEWRVFAAALLAIALGFFLSVGKRRAVA
ncbi:MAG: hypothetical protein PHH01_00780 [Patescibacteria group bacterium]|nr:hypothetical protein [Patescibacteria group bacterium]MDD5566708.1 hypothetical protein [Patescibacteria group bacterium]